MCQVLDKADIERAHMVGQIKREISIMKRLKHPNVVDLKDVMATKSKVRIPPLNSIHFVFSVLTRHLTHTVIVHVNYEDSQLRACTTEF